MNRILALGCVASLLMSCGKKNEEQNSMIQLITVDPGHFHAALVQKTMYTGVDSIVKIYAPEGPDLQLHVGRIESYNMRSENPTHWKEEIYTGNDFFEKALQEKKGSVVVLAGNNGKKTDYILKAVENGFNVLADKPMAINTRDFEVLKNAFSTSKKNNLLLYDIMTERFEIATVLQREFSMMPEVFGTIELGTLENPAVVKKSVHHFYKNVSGAVLKRPAWFMDVNQQGEGIVDVTTHLVDQVQWECFPGQTIDYLKDIELLTARRWATDMTLSEFSSVTQEKKFPSYLISNVKNDSVLSIFSNGEINYKLRGICAQVSVEWKYKAPEGGGDTHYSIMRGTRSKLVIRQTAEQQYQPTLYIEPVNNELTEATIVAAVKKLNDQFPGLEVKKISNGWEVLIPAKYREGHEAHFARVTQNYLEYLRKGNIPEWEMPNMLAKYYTTTQAFDLARKK
ncbi:oxidoreductase [Cytophagales bacterium WSM2-2]|nr:oxidoreductase [Cytophagales bacterium WSM2-2]